MAFANSRNIKIDNSKFTEIHGDYYDNVGSVSISKPEPSTLLASLSIIAYRLRSIGLVPLFNLTSPGAAFDSRERFPPAKCHPGTRTEILKAIRTWIVEGKPSIKGENEMQSQVVEVSSELEDQDRSEGGNEDRNEADSEDINESGDELGADSGSEHRTGTGDHGMAESGDEHSNEDVGCCPSVRAWSGKLVITQFVQDCAKRATHAASFFSRGRDSHKTQGIVNDEDSLRGLCSEVPSRHDPAGAGESTITQTTERGILAANFSFPRDQASRHSDEEHWSGSDDENSTRDMRSGSVGVRPVDELFGRQDRALGQDGPADASKSTTTPTTAEEDWWETDKQYGHGSMYDRGDRDRVLWLHGPAGAGKSAIAQTVAEACSKRGLLAASFFFSRGRPGRDSIDHLFVTIAYQLSISIPQFKPTLLRNLTDDLTILHKDITSQLNKLIIEPLRSDMSSSRTISQPQSPPYIVIIDGLDECTGTTSQNRILDHIHDIICHSDLPIRFLVVSRPEYNIQEAFDEPPLSQFSVKRISLYGAHKAYRDVRKYLLHEFERIYTSPMHRPWMDVPKPWPSIDIVDRLVEQSDGYFIYASTLVKFMDQEDVSPNAQLRIILTRSSESESSGPFGELDSLYRQILSVQRNTRLLKTILAAIFTDVPRDVIAGLFCLDPGQVSVVVRRLNAVLTLTRTRFGIISRMVFKPVHASYSDFIFDPARAGIFYIDPQSIRVQITRAMLDCMGRCAWTSEGSPLVVKPQPSLCEAAAVSPQSSSFDDKPRSPLFEAVRFAFEKWLHYFSRADEAHSDTLVQGITATDPQRWVPFPPEGQHPAWHDEAYDELKEICAWSLVKLGSPSWTVQIDSRLKQYLDTVRKVAFRRLLALLSPQDELIVYAFILIATPHDDAQWIHRFLRLEHPLSYRTLDIYEILSYLRSLEIIWAYLKNYLSSKDAPSELFLDFETSHTHLAHQCMTFLTEYVDQLLARAHQDLEDETPLLWGPRWLVKRYYKETKAQRYARRTWAKHLKRAKPGDEGLLEHLRTIDRRFFSDEEYFSGGIACLEGCKKVQDFPSSWPPDQRTRTYAQSVPFTGQYFNLANYEQTLTFTRMVPLFFIRNDVENAFKVISWLKKSSNTPQDLVERWERYHKDSRTRLEHKAREFLQGLEDFPTRGSYGRLYFESLYQKIVWNGFINYEATQFLAEILEEYERDYEAERSSDMSNDSLDNCKSSQLANIVFDLTWVHRRTQAHMSLQRNNVGTRGNEERSLTSP
ncbi:hypothetical protein D9615_006875 [Tricholomella constricta]|uniref:NACHT domain-containing protein n=1 Tax=Tricholomella constricta TaxID=117010 RepID=A0A8H5H8N0_9AGAR|nr:hypothetical protein D9615_006875 [Tricholomella constricta]